MQLHLHAPQRPQLLHRRRLACLKSPHTWPSTKVHYEMIANNIRRAGLFVRECQCCYSSMMASRCSTRFVKRYVSNVSTKHTKNTTRRWRLAVPASIGLSLLAATQWKYLQKHGYPIDVDNRPELLNDVMVTCYCCLPLRTTSRIWGWLTSIHLPIGLRPVLYGFYANMFHANLDEVELDLSAFPNLVEFFVRALKHNARPIAHNVNMISPADGKILYFGPVMSCRVEQVKGATYDLRYFLGDLSSSSNQIAKEIKEKDDYVNSLLKNPDNRLYQLTIYLAPGDYHRFHSPTNWDITFRRHFRGKLLSVNPKMLQYLPNLFSLNERVVYVGEWMGGFMAYAAIGATNVGSIKVYRDQTLATNKAQWPRSMQWKDANLDYIHMAKGELFGEFRLGSTIVLLFEAPQNFQFSLQTGQTVKVGEALGAYNSNETDERSIQRQHLLLNIAHEWKDIWQSRT